MKWVVTTPAAETPVTYAQVKAQLNMDFDDEAVIAYLNELIEGETANVENGLQTSLVTRTITATFYEGEAIHLPRGPVAAITSVTDDNGTVITDYDLTRVGNSDRLTINVSYTAPLVVVYTAGYGDAADVPANIRNVIKAAVATAYETRRTVTDKPLKTVPHLEGFYRLNGRGTGVA